LQTQKVHVPNPETVVFDKKTASGVADFSGIVKTQPEIGRISAGTHHSLFLDSTSGTVYGAGSNSHGQLGKTSVSGMDGAPVKLHIADIQQDQKQKIVQVACGYRHSLLLSYQGKVYESGEVPEGFVSKSGTAVYDPAPENDMDGTNVRDEFKQVPGLRSVLKIAAGSHSSAIDCKGYLYIWGTP
jgi:X-linked retinitis pigmentosa GTPase regulator